MLAGETLAVLFNINQSYQTTQKGVYSTTIRSLESVGIQTYCLQQLYKFKPNTFIDD